MPGVPHPPIVRPINWVKIATTTVSVLGGISLITVAGPRILPILQNRNLWAAGSIIAILLFISGHVFNHIRKMPYIGGDGRGGVTYFRPSPQEQFGLESQIVAAMCTFFIPTLFITNKLRWHSVLCYNRARAQGAADQQPEHTARCGLRMGRRALCHVQRASGHFQSQAQGLPVLATSVLVYKYR